MRWLLFAFCLFSSSLFAEPWGLDNDMVEEKVFGEECCDRRSTHPALGLIRFYQKHVSPIDGPRSHYRPSSSQYTYLAMKKHGFLRGWALGADRLMRENNDPWIYPIYDFGGGCYKWDPVR